MAVLQLPKVIESSLLKEKALSSGPGETRSALGYCSSSLWVPPTNPFPSLTGRRAMVLPNQPTDEGRLALNGE